MNDVDIKALPDDVATLKALILNQATERAMVKSGVCQHDQAALL